MSYVPIMTCLTCLSITYQSKNIPSLVGLILFNKGTTVPWNGYQEFTIWWPFVLDRHLSYLHT